MSKIHVHPAAAVFPMLGDEDLRKLADDIVANGQVHPCITSGGVLIDGRNRLAACEIAGVEPRFEDREFSSEDAVFSFIMSANEHRRHLNASQRAMIAAELANLKRGETKASGGDGKPAISTKDAAKAMKVSPRAVASAKRVAKANPELAAKVKSGEMPVHKAEAEAKSAGPPKEPVEPKPQKEAPKQDAKLAKQAETLAKENEALQTKLDELTGKIGELGDELEALVAENKALQEIVDAEDKVAAAAKLEKVAREMARAMKSQLDAQIKAKSAAVQAAKAANTRIAQLERKVERLEAKK